MLVFVAMTLLHQNYEEVQAVLSLPRDEDNSALIAEVNEERKRAYAIKDNIKQAVKNDSWWRHLSILYLSGNQIEEIGRQSLKATTQQKLNFF